MKYAGLVLRNTKNPVCSVAFAPVFDELLSGGVFLEEIVFAAYDEPAAVTDALSRLISAYDGVFAVCDRALVRSLRQTVSETAETEGESFFTCGGRLIGVFEAGERGAEAVRKGMALIDKRRGDSYSRVVLRAVGAPAETVASVLKRAEEAAQGRLVLHAREKYGDLRIEAIYNKETPKMIADEVVRILATELKEYLYALDDTPLPARLVDALKLHRLRISTAESFTGGGVGREIVRIAGASAVFYEGLNTYDNKAKADRLNVSQYTLMSKGAVSEETAYEMAAGLISQGNCDVALSTTGIAGPASDGTEKPVGLCYIGVGTKERVRVFRFRLSGDRECVTQTAINLALFAAYKEIG